ncbi:MAG: hypothetical protein RR248_00560 [Clostridia bacterium]
MNTHSTLTKDKLVPYLLFILAQVFAFGFIVALQFVSPKEMLWLFILVLLLMHVGIALFIVSKKLFKKVGVNLSRRYLIEYVLLLAYIPFLLIKIIGLPFHFEIPRNIKMPIIYAITAIVVVVSVYNDIIVYKIIKKFKKENLQMDKTEMKSLRIVDNFYQTSSYFPMPTMLIGTLAEDGSTTYGSYSLCFPFYIAGKDYYAMILNCRNSSNTCKNILRTGKASLNFVPASKRILRECVRLGFPGDSAKEKMKDFCLTMKDGLMATENPKEKFPKIVEESFQVFECSWVKEIDGAQDDKVQEVYDPPYHACNGITSPHGAHFILKIDKILLKEKQHKGILDGVKPCSFPPIPVDYGYRDSKNFWIATKKTPYAETVQAKAVDVESVLYAANRIDPTVQFTREACETMTKVPRIFLTTALKGCIDWAKARKITLIEKEHMAKIRDKHADDK